MDPAGDFYLPDGVGVFGDTNNGTGVIARSTNGTALDVRSALPASGSFTIHLTGKAPAGGLKVAYFVHN